MTLENKSNKTVVVGMSGGVDSSVAAYLLKEQGYNVIGVTMHIWQQEDPSVIEDNGGCCGLTAVDDARRVCDMLSIPHYVMNFKDIFKDTVIENFVSEYICGRTPNPCIRCNRYVKWEALLKRSLEIGADYIATGHYARIVKLDNGRYAITKSATDKKDQTYALYNLTQEQLSRTLFPVGDYEKEEIRKIAEKIGLLVAHKKDSQDICFVPDGDYGKFVEESGVKLPEPGEFVDKSGKVYGIHKGIHHYTIGQRKGLGISAETPLYVCDIDVENNHVVLGQNEDVFTNSLICSSLNYMGVEKFSDGDVISAKIRYSAKEAECRVTNLENGMLRCDFLSKVRAVTPGQAVVFYNGDIVLGGGIIEK